MRYDSREDNERAAGQSKPVNISYSIATYVGLGLIHSSLLVETLQAAKLTMVTISRGALGDFVEITLPWTYYR